jgi:hypothetical protein
MGGFVPVAILAALGAGNVIRGYLTADGQFTFVFIALGALALLFGLAAVIRACVDDAPVRWSRSVGRY